MSDLTWRHLHDDELPTLLELVVACEQADDAPFVSTLDVLREDMLVDVDPTTDTRVAVDDGRLVAYGIVSHHGTDDVREHDRIILYGGVHPDVRRRGVGTELLAWQLDRARAIAADLDWPTDARVYSDDRQVATAALCTSLGMKATRWFTDLRRDLNPLERPSPDGVRIVSWEPTHDEAARQLKNLAWRDHWLSTDVSAAHWTDLLASTAARRDLNLLAVTDAPESSEPDLIGLVQVDHWPEDAATLGVDGAWVSTLATHPAWRGRGIASALLAASVDRFRDAGLEAILLNVDAASPTGANRLYTNLGFVPFSGSVCHLLRVN